MDTIEVYNILKEIPSVSNEQAHKLAGAIGDKADLVTKSDLKADLAELKIELIKWMLIIGGIIIAAVGLLIKL